MLKRLSGRAVPRPGMDGPFAQMTERLAVVLAVALSLGLVWYATGSIPAVAGFGGGVVADGEDEIHHDSARPLEFGNVL